MSLRTARGWIGVFRGVLVGTAAGSSFVVALNEPQRVGSGQPERVAQEMVQARIFLEKGTSQIAVNRLESLLQDPSLSTAQLTEVRSLLARAFLQLGLPEKAYSLCAQLPQAALGGEVGELSSAVLADGCMAFAQAHMEVGRYHEAGAWYLKAREAGGDPSGALIGYGSALALEGRPSEAQAALQKGLELAGSGEGADAFRLALASLAVDMGRLADVRQFLREAFLRSDADKQAAGVLGARLMLAEGRASEAEAGFLGVIHCGQVIPEPVFLGAALGCIDALVAQSRPDDAGKFIFQFLSQNPTAPRIGREGLFRKWVKILSEHPNAPDETLRKTANLGGGLDRPLASYFLGEFYASIGKAARADEQRERFCRDYPGHALVAQACLARADTALGSGDLDQALRCITQGIPVCGDPGLRSVLQFRDASVRYKKGQFSEALERFEPLMNGESPMVAEAVFNGGLAALKLGNYRKSAQFGETLRKGAASNHLAVELELETVLQRCRDGHSQAEEALKNFLKLHPGHPREADVKLAFVELTHQQLISLPAGSAVSAGQPLRARATSYFQQVMATPLASSTAEQAAYLEVFLADSEQPRDDARIIELAEAFVRVFADSPLIPEMRMKLGEVYFRRKDFANAETQFATLLAQQPEGALAETAGYLAGQCAANLLNPGSVDRALTYWDEVARRTGPLRWRARYQQASVKCRLEQESEGVVLFDLILKASSGVDQDLRFAALCGKADALLAIAKREAMPMEQAVSQYQLLAQEADAFPHWRNQALYKIAKAYEASRPLESLEGFVQLLDSPGSMDAGEYFWVFKAGFDAARFLERQAAWRDAVSVYERMAKMPAPRAQEAGARARQIRLERFLWE